MSRIVSFDVPELILHVVSYLDKHLDTILSMSMVSRLYYWVTHTRHLWKSIGFHIYSKQQLVSTRYIKSLFDGSQLDMEIEQVRADIQSNVRENQFRACEHLRMLVTQHCPLRQPVVDVGLLPRLVELSFVDDVDLQVEAMWALNNVSAGTYEQTMAVARTPGLQNIVGLLSSPHIDVADVAAWVLANVLADEKDHRPYHDRGIRDCIVTTLMTSGSVKIVSSMMDLCEKLCCPLETRSLMLGAVPAVVHVLKKFADGAIIGHCYRSLFYLSDGNIDVVQKLVDANIGPILITQLKSMSTYLANSGMATLKLIGNFVVGEQHQATYLVDIGIVEPLKLVLGAKERYHFEVCWIVANLLTDPNHVGRVLESGILSTMSMLYATTVPKAKGEIGWSFINAARYATGDQLRYLMKVNIVEILGNLVKDINCSGIQSGAALALTKLIVESDADVRYCIRCKLYGDDRFVELKKFATEQFGVVLFELLYDDMSIE